MRKFFSEVSISIEFADLTISPFRRKDVYTNMQGCEAFDSSGLWPNKTDPTGSAATKSTQAHA